MITTKFLFYKDTDKNKMLEKQLCEYCAQSIKQPSALLYILCHELDFSYVSNMLYTTKQISLLVHEKEHHEDVNLVKIIIGNGSTLHNSNYSQIILYVSNNSNYLPITIPNSLTEIRLFAKLEERQKQVSKLYFDYFKSCLIKINSYTFD
ncbi:MAG: hypothetical protein QM538_01995 [Methylacidiphilales bacterium]|nr:hypothetical protein [Candidatus Methylacidiphilales bacterium]